MKARPPLNITGLPDEAKDKFIEGAVGDKKHSNPIIGSEKQDDLLLQIETSRDDLYKTFNLRLTERDYLKLKLVAKMNGVSMHEVCINAIIPELEKLFKNIS